jgi:hypothetical protein
MADRVFSIDFGSAYTKVALRRDPGADGEVVRTPFRAVDIPDFCFPSAVGVERRDGKNVAVCGARAMAVRPGDGLSLHTNWKRRLFAPPGDDGPPPRPPLDAFLESAELADLAAKFGVTADQVVLLRNLVATARALAPGAAATPSPAARDRAVAGPVAYHYFRWLHEQVVEACRGLKLDGLDPAAIPARVSVPAFAGEADLPNHPGCQLLLHALGKAGWRLHPDRPVVSEPYANAVGVLTAGANVVHKSRVQLGRMFGRGPLITTLKDPAHHPAYRAVVIDVGAFTTDFAAVTLDTRGAAVDDPDPAFAVRQHSARVGVGDLDAAVFDALPADKRAWLTKTAEPVQVERFRRQVYTDCKPFKTVEVGAIGGAADAEAVRAGFDSFLGRLADEVRRFLDGVDPVDLQELILTGGGVLIPRVRDALVAAARGGRHTFVKTHAPGLKKGSADGLVNGLDETTARCGSAVGGASIYFEKEYF